MEHTPTSAPRPARSEAFWLAVWISVIHLVLLAILAVVAWRSPYMLMRLPEIIKPAAAVPAAAVRLPDQPARIL